MSGLHGIPVWYERLADDVDAAQAFYTQVVGWNAADSGMPGMDYRLLSAHGGPAIAGLMRRPAEMPHGPAWLTYFGVDDVDAAVADITAAGGAVPMPAMDIPGVGRMALATDPQGTAFYVMRGVAEASDVFRQGDAAEPGHAVWNELASPDQDAAMTFYARIFGWRHDGAMPMGALGDYKFVYGGSTCIGASMNTPPGGRAGWMPYFLVDDIDAGIDRLKTAGGALIQGPDQIPGGSYSIVAQGTESVRFGLVGHRA